MRKLIIFCCILQFSICYGQKRIISDLSGTGWHLWQDKDADWRNEQLYYPYTDVRQIDIHTPTKGWEVITSQEALSIKVPGSAEEYLQVVPGPEGDIDGVTWWTREVTIPEFKGKKNVILKFGSIRQRAEIFVNQQLVHYEIVDNTPFEVNITPYAPSGQTIQLAIRVTDPGGNYDWRDAAVIPWNGHLLPPGHAFGGVTGRVSMEICDPLYVSDIYIRNTPEITTVNAMITINNTTGKKTKRTGEIIVQEWKNDQNVLFRIPLGNIELVAGEQTFTYPVSVPNAKVWDVDNPNLYEFKMILTEKGKVTDEAVQRFGFRWFEATGIGEDAIFRLNGKRIVLRSAISWSFWPVNGIFPTDELAERQIRIAKELGLNMLHFHRFIGSTNVLNYADELGLLYYEEPGGFRLRPGEQMLNTVLHEKVMRMVRRDRSHPSLVIYNLMNESGAALPDKLELELNTLKAAHTADPSRYITRTSAWAVESVDDQAKIHMRPFDENIYWNGWYDYHRAMGPATWNQDFYKSPGDYYNNTTNKTEVVFFGEEGALSAPPRLAKNKKDLEKYKYLGWDGSEYLRWYNEFDRFLDEKGLREIYPSVDTLTVTMGRVSYQHQGRKIESARINNLTDAYVVNGWESELIENFSGIVDVFRYPKSDPLIISHYNQPLFISVKSRQQIVESGGRVIVDFYIINEMNINGEHQLLIDVIDSDSKGIYHTTVPVQITGGETYGELLLEGVELPVSSNGGMHMISASLHDKNNQKEVATGYDEILAVNLKSNQLDGRGAVWESGVDVRNFLSGCTKNKIESYKDNLGKLDWVIVTRPPKSDQLTMVPTEYMATSSGEKGFDAVFYMDTDFKDEVHREIAPVINLNVLEGANPNPKVPTLTGYGVIYTGTLTPPASGEYIFKVQSNDRAVIDVIINGKTVYQILESREHIGDGKIRLEAGVPVNVKVEFRHMRSNSRCRLDWAVPYADLPDPQKLIERAKNDGTNIFILENTEEWTEFIEANSNAKFHETFYVGTNWLGGVMFNKKHPVFNELPVNDALNWPYQGVVRTGVERMGLVMEGEELLVGAYHTYPMAIGTAMGIIPVGKGKVLFSTLDLYGNILHEDSSGLVAKKIILNMIDFK